MAALRRAAGYEVLAMEFVPSEHTRKNTLIRAIRRSSANDAARAEYEALREATGGVGIRLAGSTTWAASRRRSFTSAAAATATSSRSRSQEPHAHPRGSGC